MKFEEKDLMDIARADISGQDLEKFLQTKYSSTNPKKILDLITELYENKAYTTIVNKLIKVKLLRIRSNLLKQIDKNLAGIGDGDNEPLKALDRLLKLVMSMSENKEQEETKRLIINFKNKTLEY